MRIAFICGSLESGRDGVGDYTRALSEMCEQQGHTCLLIALMDRHCGSESLISADPSAKSRPPLRLPAETPWPERIAEARRRLDEFDPEWISLQFVCYTFHPKGLVYGLAKKLAPLLLGRKLHIMFHELWIGAHKAAGTKEAVIGWIQRSFILRLVHDLCPSLVSTTNVTYIAMLKTHRIHATALPLFGSIPIVEAPDQNWLFTSALKAGLTVTAENRRDFWVFGFFASLYPGWPAEPLFTLLREAAMARGKRVVIASIGRIGDEGEHLWRELVRGYGVHFEFFRLGEQPAARVSAYFQWIDAGLAASPWELIGKSASTAAMLEHGLPVIANRDDWTPRCLSEVRPTADPLVHPLDERLPAKLLHGLQKRAPATNVRVIADKFVAELEAASN